MSKSRSIFDIKSGGNAGSARKYENKGKKRDLCFVLGLTSLWNIWGHITTVPACSSGTFTNVLPHRNAMPQTQDTTPHPVTVYRHGANLSLCYPSMWNVTLEYTATHFNVLGETRPGNPSPTFHTHTSERSTWCCHGGQQSEALMETIIYMAKLYISLPCWSKQTAMRHMPFILVYFFFENLLYL